VNSESLERPPAEAIPEAVMYGDIRRIEMGAEGVRKIFFRHRATGRTRHFISTKARRIESSVFSPAETFQRRMGGAGVSIGAWQEFVLGICSAGRCRKRNSGVFVPGTSRSQGRTANRRSSPGSACICSRTTTNRGAEVYCAATKRDQARIVWVRIATHGATIADA